MSFMPNRDDSDEINIKRQRKNEFAETISPLLDLIKRTDGLVMTTGPDDHMGEKGKHEKKTRSRK